MTLRIKGSKRITFDEDWVQIRALSRRERESARVRDSIPLGRLSEDEAESISPELLAASLETSNEGDLLEAVELSPYDLVSLCTKAIEAWSEVDEQGSVLPITEQSVSEFSDSSLTRIGTAILRMTSGRTRAEGNAQEPSSLRPLDLRSEDESHQDSKTSGSSGSGGSGPTTSRKIG